MASNFFEIDVKLRECIEDIVKVGLVLGQRTTTANFGGKQFPKFLTSEWMAGVESVVTDTSHSTRRNHIFENDVLSAAIYNIISKTSKFASGV